MKLNKAQRMMVLYQKLSKGEYVCKSTFCKEYEIEEWTFDRYIADIRNLLSETFSLLEVVYDRKSHSYYMENLHLKHEIGLVLHPVRKRTWAWSGIFAGQGRGRRRADARQGR